MTDVIVSHYLWFKALHIVAVISWMAGLLYLPRLFVYHATAETGSELSETLKIMERKLLRVIMTPAMLVTWTAGLLMIMSNPALMQGGWMHAKMALVLALSGFHGALSRWRRGFLQDNNKHTHSFYRKVNEIPTVLMILIVVMVVVRPF